MLARTCMKGRRTLWLRERVYRKSLPLLVLPREADPSRRPAPPGFVWETLSPT